MLNQGQELAKNQFKQFLFNKDQKYFCIDSMAGTGKALANSERVLTPTGFKPMGSLTTADQVIGSKGEPVRILKVYPQGIRDIYRVHFIDGTYVDCDDEHLWAVTCEGKRGALQNLTTAQLRQDKRLHTTRTDKRYGTVQNRYKYAIPLAAPCVSGEDIKLPLHPYLLGILLGDGGFTSNTPCFTNGDSKIINRLKELLPEGVEVGREVFEQGVYRVSMVNSVRTTNPSIMREILQELGLYGLKSPSKFIPELYKQASLSQRKQLVQGLIDTDGHMKGDWLDEFSTSSKALAYDFLDMARSIGMYLTISDRKGKYIKEGVTHHVHTAYRIRERKTSHKSITRIEYQRQEEATCILVDSPDHLFVCSGYNLTHNTYLLNHLHDELTQFNKQLQFMGNSSYKDMVFTATTNKASAVLNDAMTVHKTFGLVVFDNYKTGGSTVKTTTKTRNLSNIILVVDEASMIDPKIEKIIDKYTQGSKVIFVGDSYQLAPVKHAAPVVFTRGYPTAVLTEPMRQDKDSLLYKSCISLREEVKAGCIEALQSHAQIRFVDATTFKHEIVETFRNQEDARILAYTNKQVEGLNSFVRKSLHGVIGFRAGDPVVAANALEGKVKIERTYIIESISEPYEDNVMEVQNVTLHGSNEIFKIPVNKQKYFSMCKRAKAEAKQDGTWTGYFKLINNYLDIRDAFACTVNKSQGSTYEKVYLDYSNIATCWDVNTLARLRYVGVSRAKQECVIYGL